VRVRNAARAEIGRMAAEIRKQKELHP